MNNKSLAVTFFALATFAVGCKPSNDNTPSQQLDQVKVETKADAKEIRDFTYAQRAEFVSTMQGQLDALNKDLDALSTKIQSSSDAVKADAKPKLQAMRDEATALNKQLDSARNSTESTWDSVKMSSQKAYDSLKGDFQQSRQWASDKIAP